MMQPDTPGLHIILMFLSVETAIDVATKELELLVGVSSGSRTPAGALIFENPAADPAGDAKEAET